VRFWSQDLTERKANGKKPIGGSVRQGRATWYLRHMDGPGTRDKSLSAEWHFFTKAWNLFHVYFEAEPSGDHDSRRVRPDRSCVAALVRVVPSFARTTAPIRGTSQKGLV
jgi:hypothetical protein